ncbi:MAG TPA: ComEA family DNA-binding protein [Patescibacteria group bacterium]|nr:ComEA family DNA-binding protein [Patescibacteria group bacterium]
MEDYASESSDNRILDFIKSNILILALFLAGMMLLGYGLIQMTAPKKTAIKFEDAPSVADAKTDNSTKIKVDVAGEVIKPGVYDLPQNSRVQDALVAAGGLSSNADRNYISKSMNLAQVITDGAKIYIPRVGEEGTIVSNSTAQVAGVSTTSNGLTSVNNASEGDLEDLPGIGPVTASKIIDNRPYASLDELVSKKAIGKATFEKIKDQISL